jgi:hypothetical protein
LGDRVSLFAQGQPRLWSSYLYYLCIWDDRHEPPNPATGWEKVSQTMHPRLAWSCYSPPRCCYPCSWDYSHEPLAPGTWHSFLLSWQNPSVSQLSKWELTTACDSDRDMNSGSVVRWLLFESRLHDLPTVNLNKHLL